MKKVVFVVLILLVSVGTIEKLSARSLQAAEKTLEVSKHQELSIKQAIELAYPSALKWNENAQLLVAINIDIDKPGKGIGANGKRKNWNISFGVPDTNKYFLVTIHDGKIDGLNDLTTEGTSPYPKKEFVGAADIKYDSPELLKKALEMGSIYPGKDWAKGYNFMLRKDTVTNISLMLVIGWNSNQTEMKAVGFNVTTGEYIPPKNLLGILMYSQIAFAETDEGVPFLISNGKCPDSQNLEPVSSDKGLLNALNTIIPEVYKNQNYKGWKIESIAHLSESPHPDAYYAMAKNYCGEEIANNSWFVEVLFPQYLPAYDASHRQIFVTKNKQGQWFAWFRFH